MSRGRSPAGEGARSAPGCAAEPPQAPRRGWVARLLGPFHVTGVVWYRLHALGASLPEWVIRPAIPVFVALFFCALWSIRRAVARNLEVVLGPCGFLERQRRIWRTFRAVAWSQTERYERLATEREFTVRAQGRERWERAAGGGSGCVLLTAHVGNWEMASALPAVRESRRVHVVREEEVDPAAQEFVESRLRRHGGERYTTHFAAGLDPRLGLALREALERGEIVALQGDRPRRVGGGVEVELFGLPFRVPAGPFALARQTGAPLLPAFVVREGRRRYRVVFGEVVEVERSGDRGEDVRGAAERFAVELEGVVRRWPYQWFVFRELWED